MLFPGWIGVVAGVGVLIVVGSILHFRIERAHAFVFEKHPGGFQELLKVYLDILKFILTLAAGGIVLIIGSTSLSTARRLPPSYANPLFMIVMSMMYGIAVMILLTLDYDSYRDDENHYRRFRYLRNMALGISSIICFCAGYFWLIVAATHS